MKLDIPNAQTGHTTLTFNTNVPEDVARAEQQFNDMTRLGYTIFVESEGKTERVTKFDATKGVYNVGDREIPAQGSTATAVAPPSGGCIAR